MVVQENIHGAKTHFSRLIERALRGDEVIIAKAGKPVVRLVPVARDAARVPGGAKGLVVSMAEDFDAPLEDFTEHMR
jgi:prevent-host-death family protein